MAAAHCPSCDKPYADRTGKDPCPRCGAASVSARPRALMPAAIAACLVVLIALSFLAGRLSAPPAPVAIVVATPSAAPAAPEVASPALAAAIPSPPSPSPAPSGIGASSSPTKKAHVIDREAAFSRALQRSKTSDTTSMIVTRARFELRRAHLDVRDDGCLTDDDMEWLAKISTKNWVEFIAGPYSDDRHAPTDGEIRNVFDRFMTDERAENEKFRAGIAHTEASDRAVEHALGK